MTQENNESQVIAAVRNPASADVFERLGESWARTQTRAVKNILGHSQSCARWLRRQAEFNQVMRFVLAAPLVAGTATSVSRDYRPLTAEQPTAASYASVDGRSGVPIEVRTGHALSVQPAPPTPIAEAIPGPRVRANCSRGTRTVFLDDRPAVEATEDWKEGLTQRYQGAVCSFAPRFGLPEPGFRAYEAPATAQTLPARSVETTSEAPIKVKASIERESGFGEQRDDVQGDGIERALAALGAPPLTRPIGGSVPNDKAKAAIAALAAADGVQLLPSEITRRPAAANRSDEATPHANEQVHVRWADPDLMAMPFWFNYRWTSKRVESVDLTPAPLDDQLYFHRPRQAIWAPRQEHLAAGVQMAIDDLAAVSDQQWLGAAGQTIGKFTGRWPVPATGTPATAAVRIAGPRA